METISLAIYNCLDFFTRRGLFHGLKNHHTDNYNLETKALTGLKLLFLNNVNVQM